MGCPVTDDLFVSSTCITFPILSMINNKYLFTNHWFPKADEHKYHRKDTYCTGDSGVLKGKETEWPRWGINF